MASLSEMLITPRSAAVPWAVFASCAAAVPMANGTTASAIAVEPASERLMCNGFHTK